MIFGQGQGLWGATVSLSVSFLNQYSRYDEDDGDDDDDDDDDSDDDDVMIMTWSRK